MQRPNLLADAQMLQKRVEVDSREAQQGKIRLGRAKGAGGAAGGLWGRGHATQTQLCSLVHLSLELPEGWAHTGNFKLQSEPLFSLGSMSL